MRSLLIKIIGYSLPFIAAILFVEAALQIHFYYKNGYSLWQGHKNFAVPYVERVTDSRQYTLKPGYKDDNIAINENGFRGAVIAKTDPAVCVVGDSVPYGAGVKNGETFPDDLSRLLAADNIPLKVLNAGVPSYNLKQSIDMWREAVQDYNCKVVIINAANDISLIDFYGKNWNENLTWASARFNIEKQRRSALVYYLAQLYEARFGQSGKLDQAGLETALTKITRELRSGIGGITKREQTVILMPIQPCYYEQKPLEDAGSKIACKGNPGYADIAHSYQPLITELNQRIAGSVGENVFLYDTNSILEKDGVREGAFVDFIHFSPHGNELIANGLYEFMKSHGLVQ